MHRLTGTASAWRRAFTFTFTFTGGGSGIAPGGASRRQTTARPTLLWQGSDAPRLSPTDRASLVLEIAAGTVGAARVRLREGRPLVRPLAAAAAASRAGRRWLGSAVGGVTAWLPLGSAQTLPQLLKQRRRLRRDKAIETARASLQGQLRTAVRHETHQRLTRPAQRAQLHSRLHRRFTPRSRPTRSKVRHGWLICQSRPYTTPWAAFADAGASGGWSALAGRKRGRQGYQFGDLTRIACRRMRGESLAQPKFKCAPCHGAAPRSHRLRGVRTASRV